MRNEDAMYAAILRGDTAFVRELLASAPSVVNAYAVKKTWLHWAAQKGNVQKVDGKKNAGMHTQPRVK